MHHPENLLRLLILNTSSHEAEVVLNVLRKAGYATRPRLINDLEEAADALAEGGWDLALTGEHLGTCGLDAILPVLAGQEQDIPIIVLCAQRPEDLLVRALKLGARDCVRKDHPRHLTRVVGRELADVTQRRARRQCESLLREYQQRHAALLESSEAAVAYVLDGMHIHVNGAYRRLLGVDDPRGLDGVPLMDLVSPGDQDRFRGFLRRLVARDQELDCDVALQGPGAAATVTMTFTPSVYDGEACHQVVVRRAGSDSPGDAASLGQDPVTGLIDHHALLSVLEQRMNDAVSSQRRTCLLYAELDDYAAVRERLGVSASYDVVKDVAALFQEELGDQPLLARCGDAAFAVVADGSDPRTAETLGQRMLDALSQHILEIKGQSVAVTCSIGSTAVTELTPSARTALDWAARACRAAAAGGGNRLHHYRPVDAMDTGNFTHAARGAALLQALEDGTLRLLLQPVVSLHGLTTPIYRVLPSMALSDEESLTGEDLLTVAEDHHLAAGLDGWVVERVLEHLAQAQERLDRTIFLVQLTDGSMANEALVLALGKALRGRGLDPSRVVFALSETAAVTHIKSARSFSAGVHQFGCGVAVAYFGSALNPFKLLDHVAAEYLMLDESFIGAVLTSEANRRVVEEMHREARNRGKFTIAPGVRDANTLALLWQCGVDYAAGDYLQEPAPDMTFDFSQTELL